MSYRNAIPDIAPGSTWIAPDGLRVVVVSAAARHVVYRAPDLAVLHEIQFRASFQPVYDRSAMRSQFSMCLANLGAFTAYWIGRRDKFMARSVSCTRRFRIPDGARQIDTYEAPFSPDTFLEDLDDLLARIDHDARQARAAGA